MRKAKEFAKMDINELELKLKELKNTYSKEYVKSKIGSKTEKSLSLRNLKKDIARVLTYINAKAKADAAKSKIKQKSNAVTKPSKEKKKGEK